MNLCSILACHAVGRADKTAIEFNQQRISYADLWQQVEACAGYLYTQGVRAGDRIGLALKEHPAHLILHYALPRLGAVILPIDHRWTASEKQAAAKAFDARLLITEADAEPLDAVKTIILHDDWRDTQPRELPDMPDMPDKCNMPLLISLSSGTTGRPKGALVTHEQMYARFISQWVTMGFHAGDRFLAVTPLFFGAGRSFGMCFLAAGATVILDPPPHKPEQLAAAINNSQASVTFLVPTLLLRLLPLADKHTPLLPGLQCLLVSGAILYPAEAKEIRQRISPNLTGYYASSEGGGIAVLSADEFSDYADTVGRPAFRTEVQIVDGDGNHVKAGDTGRLRYRGPAIARQFLDSDGHEQAAEVGGWFYPGDLASLTSTGHIMLRGRDKDVINRGGVNIYPAEIEAVLMRYDAVSEVAVVGRKSAELGEDVIAYVASADPAIGDLLKAYCRTHLAPYKVPSQFILLDQLPKKASGKINKQALLEQSRP